VPNTIPDDAGPGRLQIGEAGLVERVVLLGSADDIATLTIAEGVRAVDAAGNPLRAVTLVSLDAADVPAVPGVGAYAFTGYAWLAGPEGAAFSPPVTLSFNFTEEQWDAVYNGSGLVVQRYDRSMGAWEEVPTTVHPEIRSVTAVASHFNPYALFIEVPDASAAQVVAAETGPQSGTVPDLPYAHLIPGLLALILVGAGALLYFRKEGP
jgi:hypothetical protein